MKAIVYPSKLSGSVFAPSSKSYLQRALAASLLTKGESQIFFNSLCDDSKTAIEIVKNLGAEIKNIDNGLLVKGGFNPKTNILQCNESGLCLRMFSPIASLFDKSLTLYAKGSLLKRSHSIIINSLSKFGVDVISENSFPPVKINGPLRNGNVIIDGSESSQVITGLLMSLPMVDGDSVLEVNNIVSTQYIDMTIGLLKDFGIKIKKKNYNIFEIKGGQKYKPINYHVEGDWSGASFFIVEGLINGNIEIEGLNERSLQADRNILHLLRDTKSDFHFNETGLLVNQSEFKGFNFDASNCPDLFPPLVTLAACSSGVSQIKGISRLYNKESNRAKSLILEFSKLGINLYSKDDSLIVHGGSIKSAEADSHNDHRIAMAMAIAGINAEGPVTINGIESINKSYPEFFIDLKSLGAKIIFQN